MKATQPTAITAKLLDMGDSAYARWRAELDREQRSVTTARAAFRARLISARAAGLDPWAMIQARRIAGWDQMMQTRRLRTLIEYLIEHEVLVPGSRLEFVQTELDLVEPVA